MKRIGLIVGVVSMAVGCMPTMPSPPSVEDIKPQFAIKAAALDPQIESAARACQGRLNAIVIKAKNQRNGSIAAAIVGASGAVTNATLSAALDDDGAKKATAIAAGGFALVAASARFIGDPSDELRRYATSYAHYQRAARIADRLAVGVDYPDVKEEPVRFLAPPPQTPLTPEQVRWNALALAVLDELRLCASENGEGGSGK